ncbi:MAG: type II secretion system protein [Candidatus Paceibacterota bacterium]|jgi:prepilin-type N-terminal cleavage/methylation domain-containing protein
MNCNKKNLGFTLIELLMVISIITLFSSMFFSYVGSARAKSRDSVRLSDMKQIGTAATLYYEDKGVLPVSIGGSGSDSLVGAGYLSAEPKDPKTGDSYKFSSGKIDGKSVFTASATYESIFTTATDGSATPQQVGIFVGDIDTSNICSLIKQFTDLTGKPVDVAFPLCDSNTNTSNDQIIGSTSGHRRSGGGGGTTIEDTISNCSEIDVSKTCPNPMYQNNCYCENTIKNINSLTESSCKSSYGLFWMNDFIIDNYCFGEGCQQCVDKTTCSLYNSSYKWDPNDNTCYAVEEAEFECISSGGYYNRATSECYTIINSLKWLINPNSSYKYYWSDIDCTLPSEAQLTNAMQYQFENGGQLFSDHCYWTNVDGLSVCYSSEDTPRSYNPTDNLSSFVCLFN